MSRIGKKPIEITQGVEAKIEGQRIIIKGPKGELSREVRPEIKIEIKEGKVFVALRNDKAPGKEEKALWGLTRALIFNMFKGVTQGYEKKLEIEGVGFRAEVKGEELNLSVGFTHQIKIKAPKDVKFAVDKNVITVLGVDKEIVGQTAAIIRKSKLPEPYKGKGIKYSGEIIRRKIGKKAITAVGAK